MSGARPREDAAVEFDPAKLDAFLREAVPGLAGAMRLQRVSGGQSNPTFFVSYDNRRLVLRKKPPGEILPSAHAVDREYRILTALAETDVPVPRTILFHESPNVVGTPFYVMERLEGRVFAECALPGHAPGQRRAIYLSMAQTMARLHKVDWQAVGLQGFGKPGNYFARQIARWTKQWQLSKTRDIPEIDWLTEWLPQHIPPGDETTIAHGDFRLGNLMFDPERLQVIGVLDWELSTLGHPLADVAYNCIAWRTFPSEFGGLRGRDLAELGIPSEAEYLEHYYREAGRTSGIEPFHMAFSMFRLAVIFEGIAARALQGNAVAQDAAEKGELSVVFARRAVEAAQGDIPAPGS